MNDMQTVLYYVLRYVAKSFFFLLKYPRTNIRLTKNFEIINKSIIPKLSFLQTLLKIKKLETILPFFDFVIVKTIVNCIALYTKTPIRTKISIRYV